MTEKKVHVEIWERDREKMMLFKIKARAKNMPDAIRLMLKKLKEVMK